MKVLLTGSTGYIGRRLMQQLLDDGHEVLCFVRNLERLVLPDHSGPSPEGFEVDLSLPIPDELNSLQFDVAFYLVHSMSTSIGEFMEEEARSAGNFASYIKQTHCKQIIYLSGISNSRKLSRHLQSRKNVEEILRKSEKPVTVLRAGIIVGSGSASFEIIRDLMEKMPWIIAPLWVKTLCQPIAITNVIRYLTGCMLNPRTFNDTFDIGGAEILSYKEMLLQYAEVRGLKRHIGVVSFISPRISSYWLYFVTSTSYYLAVNLVDSMKVEVVCKDNRLREILQIPPLTYKEACKRALERINLDTVQSSWTDAVSMKNAGSLFGYLEVPDFGVLRDHRRVIIKGDPEIVWKKVLSIGGDTGWYFADWIWQVRGMIDKLVGGVGLRRGRRNATDLRPGDSLDFWRVLIADKERKRLLLFAEMKVPGEAWLEFRIVNRKEGSYLYQTATFMPKGLSGRLYWFLLLPIHLLMFQGMIKEIASTHEAWFNSENHRELK
ncbi:MAG: SDR family oxidoreductase [Bacteroidales bacterium]|nr:SDR family oxidoreductase [Bacteroidales bacterium]